MRPGWRRAGPCRLRLDDGVGHEPAGDLLDLGWLGCRHGRGDRAAEWGEVVTDAGVPAAVAAAADLPPQPGRVSAAVVPPLVQVGDVLVEDAGPAPGTVMNQELFGVGGAGEPADGVAGQAQLGGDREDAVAVGQQLVDRRVALVSPLRDPP